MPLIDRRRLLTRVALAGAGLAAAPSALAAAPAPARTGTPPTFGPVTVEPGDPRYASFLVQHNTRFTGSPARVTVAGSAGQVADALAEAAARGHRVAARSGGHCMEDFTTSSEVKHLIDLSQLNEVYFDPARTAFAVEPGAIVAPTQGTLFKGWGVMIPSAGCAEVGLGGHILGGGYNFYSRMHGLAVDHLQAVEVVTVDASGQAHVTVATRDRNDPHRELWWAHTGGGGGNFGIVTKYWFRTPGVASTDPSRLLPRAYDQRVRMLEWSWEDVSPGAFTTLTRNFCRWFEHNSAPGSPKTQVWASYFTPHQSAGTIGLMAGVSADAANGEALLADFLAEVTANVGVATSADHQYSLPWLDRGNWYQEPAGRQKNKTSDLRRSYTDAQIATIHSYLTDDSYANAGAQVNISALGGQINATAPGATAAVHRDSTMRVYFTAGTWSSEAEDAANIAWVRNLYRDVYAASGGVPVPDAVNAGAYINYPDVDLADPAWNTSGTPWHSLYYGANYARLQQVKKHYDPRGLFRHALSVHPAA
ncbi:FAD-dependent oxidoreductase [Actinosynnema pretiosum]|uniref:FAD-dependent oxidoreductase n=1 Tax=Actinosynnema pretiosum TaxID=42197 RepID=UPI0018DF839E|nr:BBE domain-containing protein [Actinosynnema pretiosum]